MHADPRGGGQVAPNPGGRHLIPDPDLVDWYAAIKGYEHLHPGEA
jgi:hypothetical protein